MADTILKRTTLIVADADRTRSFYENVLGWRTYYAAQMQVTGKVIPIEPAGATVQLYIMERDEREFGKIGILQWLDPELPDTTPTRTRLGIGDVVFVADHDNVPELAEKIANDPGARICAAPMDWSFPAPDGSGDIELTSMSFFDPDGHLHEVYYRHNRPNPDGYLIRRSTTLVRDIEKSIALYRDALGLEIYQDAEMNLSGGMEIPAGERGARMRLTVFRSNDPYIGMIGALQFLDPPLPEPTQDTWAMGVGKVVFVGGHQDAQAAYEKIQANDVKVTCPPLTRTVPKSGGEGEIPMTTVGFYDPDGQLWELNQR